MYTKIPLDYSSLEPNLSNKTIETHYNILYNNYVTRLNAALVAVNYKKYSTLPELVADISNFQIKDRKDILYNLGGTLNHGLYFYNISNRNNILPVGKIKEAIDKEFGNYENFKQEFIKYCQNVVGSGYTFLVLDSSKKLKIINMKNQDTPFLYGYIPIMTIDLWEHAYFLDYVNRNDYINAFFNIVDYEKINSIYEKYL